MRTEVAREMRLLELLSTDQLVSAARQQQPNLGGGQPRPILLNLALVGKFGPLQADEGWSE